jgi:hypothetical protein
MEIMKIAGGKTEIILMIKIKRLHIIRDQLSAVHYLHSYFRLGVMYYCLLDPVRAGQVSSEKNTLRKEIYDERKRTKHRGND